MYSLSVVVRCVLHYDELLEIVPEARQPTPLQLVKLDMQQAFGAAARDGWPHLAGHALSLCAPGLIGDEWRDRLAQQIAHILLPYLNGGSLD